MQPCESPFLDQASTFKNSLFRITKMISKCAVVHRCKKDGRFCLLLTVEPNWVTLILKDLLAG